MRVCVGMGMGRLKAVTFNHNIQLENKSKWKYTIHLISD